MILPNNPNPNHWRLGVFYYNREDRRLLVPKRYGIGMTLNFARRAAWAITGVILLILLGALFTLGTRRGT